MKNEGEIAILMIKYLNNGNIVKENFVMKMDGKTDFGYKNSAKQSTETMQKGDVTWSKRR